MCNVVNAIGFGNLKLYSYLNEPLSAEIEVLGAQDLNIRFIKVGLAEPKDFLRANMARSFLLTKLKFEVIKTNDKTFIYVSSQQSIQEPTIDFLLDLNWPDGKIIKRHTILLGPKPTDLTKRETPAAILAQQQAQQKVLKVSKPKPTPKPKPVVKAKPKVAKSVKAGDDAFLNKMTKTNVDAVKTDIVIPSPDELARQEQSPEEDLFAAEVAQALQQFEPESNDQVKTSQDTSEDLIANSGDLQVAKTLPTPSKQLPIKKLPTAKEPKSPEPIWKKYLKEIMLSLVMIGISIFAVIKIRGMQKNKQAVSFAPASMSTTVASGANALQAEAVDTVPEPKGQTESVSVNENMNADENFSAEDIDFGDDSFDEALQDLNTGEEEVELKLKLAKQYIDAGDSSSAQEVLQEIIPLAEGSTKEEAETLLAQL